MRLRGRTGWSHAGVIATACMAIVLVWAEPSLVIGAAPRDAAQLPAPAFPSAQALLAEGRPHEAIASLARGSVAADEADELERLLLIARAAEDAAAKGRSTASSDGVVVTTGAAAAEPSPIEAAKEAWGAVATRQPALRALATRRTVELLLRVGALEDADALVRSQLSAATGETRALVLRVAAEYDTAQQPDRARPLYELVLEQQSKGTDADRARLGLAGTLEALGRRDEALEMWREAQLRLQDAATFRAAWLGERRLSRAMGRALDPLAEADYDALSRRLARASRFDDVLELLDGWQQALPRSTARAQREARRISALYDLRRNEEARQAAEAFERGDGPLSLKADMAVMRFRLAVRDGQAEAATRLGRAIWTGQVRGVAEPSRRSVGSLLANYWLSLGRTEEALTLYRDLYTSATKLGDKRSFLLRLSIAAVRAGQDSRAVANLRALSKLGPQGDAGAATDYWLGVALDGMGEREAAILTLADVESENRYSYYGYRATERLDDLASRGIASRDAVSRARAARSRRLPFPDMVVSRTARSHHDFALATALGRAGLSEEAARLYRRLSARLKGDEALALLAARASAAADDHRAAVGLVMSYFADTITRGADREPDDLRQLAYPRPFRDVIEPAAETAGVDAHLLTSLMRRESRFDPRARSVVGALGLFQIMPYTASAIAPSLGMSANGDEQVLEPRVNVAIAAALVARLTKMFGSALPPVVASYNAGEDRVSDWWRASISLAPDMFVEIIPYAETRGFVREVLANRESYARLYR